MKFSSAFSSFSAPATKLARVSIVLSVASCTLACSNDDDDICDDTVVTRADPDADYSIYKTFAIGDATHPGAGGAGGASDLPDDVDANLKTANEEAAAQLKEKGLTEVGIDEDPDLLIYSASTTEDKNGTYWECIPGWYWDGWYYQWDPCAWYELVPVNYSVGTFIIGVADTATQTPVYGGAAEGILECTSDVGDTARIQAAVDEIFANYPALEE